MAAIFYFNDDCAVSEQIYELPLKEDILMLMWHHCNNKS